MNILLLTLISSSAFNVTIYLEVFATPFEWGNSNFFRLCHSHVIQLHLHAMRMVKCHIRVWMHANRLRETLSWLSHSNAFWLVRTAFWPTIRTPFLSIWYQIAQRITYMYLYMHLMYTSSNKYISKYIQTFTHQKTLLKHVFAWF